MRHRFIRRSAVLFAVLFPLVVPSLALAEPGDDSEDGSEPAPETAMQFEQRVYGAPNLSPADGEAVGIAQPVLVNFSKPVAPADRGRVQEAVTITTNPPQQGVFYWYGDKQLRWRPSQFWTPGTVVDVQAGATRTHYSIGDAFVTVADDATHQVTVTRNGKVIKTMPVSMGGDKFPTPNGTYYIQERLPTVVMDSSTFGIPTTAALGYKLNVQYATRISWSGIYLHSAPWAAGAIGKYDQSHGCLNLNPADAQWFMENSHRGDPVIVKNSKGGILSKGDGLGDWN
ncbi:ErfK/YbiS/YcfS/YnhG family protein [Segniliparus rotundus DSM 44985]|uniref:ErfK/YbiS/YcfS/YnhG family protein n=1 Tax=Segniliparus rotundus (strain ATCC BAA-972 / CDC 1076 / CIP 108378 / DSM 44985 / JCM 13578) TaxID=640132 RepID=D6ZBM0_SEGRD|nr:L,D-transpeptidase [Segniliparus rotundus]ADG98972.1 ErfK/YbiS/YcfS/YnhG family protein [Segniliparus rotundus DSM 44985]